MTGLKNLPSDFSVKETLDRLAALVSSHGLTVFIRIDHRANADQVDLPLRPTEVIFFGNPKAGTVLMQDKQTAGLDLPMKALAWEDENGKVWLTYNEVEWISQRHELTDKSASMVKAIEDGMTMVCNSATKK
ncbi:Uncharacterized conserved protein, DUF302 family [Chryseolinea serpens]|uniref:Uncharacterized conserved protein, DUF302 family n=1 Tax=Chryseolinea serpens TaxID=947013 RepID=A0A1M5SDG2_9BACT|nr:DUF302 domain-containing protein [Chryseolinea serpens]SHH36546.1 Uncharacterized conserved protein, DUF302 family [Chryseolinea serpens]